MFNRQSIQPIDDSWEWLAAVVVVPASIVRDDLPGRPSAA